MKARLAGRAALVTGGSRGIGAAVARRLAAEGARVAVGYRERAAEAHALAEEVPGDAFAVQLDVRRRESVREAIDAVAARFGAFDLLVNNAGALRQEPFLEITDAGWDEMLDVNLKGTFLCAQEAARRFLDAGGGVIVNVSSVGARLGGTKAPHYAAAKAGVLSLTRSLARLLAPAVRVNAVAPGLIRTDMYEEVRANADGDPVARVPLERIGEPDEVAAAVAYLASPDAAYVTGAILDVNGGLWTG